MNDLAALDPVVVAELERDDTAIYMHTHPPGEWVERIGPARVRTCAISEAAMVGIGTGAAMSGLRPIVDLNRASFVLCAMDQICNHAAKVHYLSGGEYAVPLTITCALRGDYRVDAGREHAPYGMFVNVPGLTVVVPGTLPDACALLRSSIRHDGPVLLFVSPLLADDESEGDPDRSVRLGRARVVREGGDVTIVAIGACVGLAKLAADELAVSGVHAEVVDPLTLAPLDVEALRASVLKTRRLVVVEDATGRATAGMGICSRLAGDPEVFGRLDAEPEVVTAGLAPMPASPARERQLLPSVDRVVRAVRGRLERSARGARPT